MKTKQRIAHTLRSTRSLCAVLALGLSLSAPQAAQAGSEPFLGEIQMVGFNFAPRGWAHCDGQLLPINSYPALFSLLGTTYGGDGRTTFALPDLRGRSAVHPGAGPGLSPIQWGQRGGAEFQTLTTAQMPSHSHSATTSATLKGVNARGDSATPGGNALASKPRTNIYSTTAPNVAMAAGSVTATTTVNNTGGSQQFSIRDPFLGVYHVIALQGIFPSHN